MSLPDALPTDSADLTERRLLQSIVEVARNVFDSAAASIFLVDPVTHDLVFEAVSGEGEDHLLGARFPMGTGIAGWVAVSGQPMIIDDVADVDQFAQDAAESTGYTPTSIMAAPLIRHDECIGVLEVLDRAAPPRGELDDMDLLVLLGTQAACGLELLLRIRKVNITQPEALDAHAVLSRLADQVPKGATTSDTAALKLIAVATELLGQERTAGPGAT